MVVAAASFWLVLLGATVAARWSRGAVRIAARAELIGGGLMATGLILVGTGLQSSFS